MALTVSVKRMALNTAQHRWLSSMGLSFIRLKFHLFISGSGNFKCIENGSSGCSNVRPYKDMRTHRTRGKVITCVVAAMSNRG